MAMYNLAIVQYGQKQYEQSLATLDRFLAETKSDKQDAQQLRAALLANLGRSNEAAKMYEDQLAKNPNDKKALMNAVATYQEAKQDDKANALLEDAYKKGMLTEPKELRALYVGYMNAERYKDAQRVMEEGETKGILKPGPELATDYMVRRDLPVGIRHQRRLRRPRLRLLAQTAQLDRIDHRALVAAARTGALRIQPEHPHQDEDQRCDEAEDHQGHGRGLHRHGERTDTQHQHQPMHVSIPEKPGAAECTPPSEQGRHQARQGLRQPHPPQGSGTVVTHAR